MTQLTDEMIIDSFNSSLPFFKFELIVFTVMFLFVFFFNLIKLRRNKKYLILVTITIFILSLPLFREFFIYNAINYSIQNNSWYVVTDTVKRTISNGTNYHSNAFPVYLSKYGKVSVSNKIYPNILKNESVYVVIVKGRFGKTYATGQIYPTNDYIYTQ